MNASVLRLVSLFFLLPVTALPAQTDYTAVIYALETFVARELREKGIPAAAIALVDDQKIVWSRGFGVARPEKIPESDTELPVGPPMTPETPIRAGSVSKLFTSILVMREVEAGRLDLDASITNYLPLFRPKNQFGKPITLRHILSHRSGLVREPPYGNYFETNQAALWKTVASLSGTEVVYEPGERVKYSNAAIAAAGYIAALASDRSFPTLASKNILLPLGMANSAFGLPKRLRPALATGVMWTLHGTKFEAPVFEWGMSPAASLTTTVIDLAKFGGALFADANGAQKLLRKETLEKMWEPQFAAPDAKTGFGLGFSMGQLDGHRRAGHNGAVYGFATDFSLLPDDKLGVVVVVTRDFANTVASRVSTLALRGMLAARAGRPFQLPPPNDPIPTPEVRAWAGSFVAGSGRLELEDFGGKLHLLRGGLPAALRKDGTNFVVDGLIGHGGLITPGETANELQFRGETYRREMAPGAPPAAPEEWRQLIGEYGWDHDVLYIFERAGRLWSLIEWFEFAPIERVEGDVYKFPDHGSYAGEKLLFKRDKSGAVTEVVAAEIRFKRRNRGAGDGLGQAKIRPQKPVEGLMKKASQMIPPSEKREFKKPDLVELASLDPTLSLEIRYATTNNFLGSVFYAEPRAFLQRPAAEALVRVSAKLRGLGYGLRIFDGYRPWAVTKVFWDATTEAQHEFVADPSKGSRHNRGCAVDLTLYDLASGSSIEMPGTYDETTDRSYPTFPGGTSRQRWHRDLLRRMMESEGFTVYHTEWWHFDYQDWRDYPILNVPFSKL